MEEYIEVLGFLLFLGFFLLIGFISRKFNKKQNINKVFEYMDKTMKPKEKYNVIQELFIKSAILVDKNLKNKNNLVTTVYTAELAMHILALWLSNYMKKFEITEPQKEFLYSMTFNSYIIVIKEFLNILIEKGIGQKRIDNDIVKGIIVSRMAILTTEQDFQIRNANFICLCNLAIKYEEDCVFWVGKSDELPLEFGSALDNFVLLSAYKIGLVDEFLEKLDGTV